jgi:flagellin-like protein
MYKNRKAVSPVIATVILVAVAITISVAVAYWMGGISSQYTKFEKVEVSNAVVSLGTSGAAWDILVSLKNTGTSQCTLTSVFVNNNEVLLVPVAPAQSNWSMSVGTPTIQSGAEAKVLIQIYDETPFADLSPGTTVNLKFHSAGGMDYLKLVELI